VEVEEVTDVETVMTEEEIEIMVVEEVETEMEEIEKAAIDAAEEMIGKYSLNQNVTNFV
jgi:hypothetical protein